MELSQSTEAHQNYGAEGNQAHQQENGFSQN